jgi:hypothetical protein
MTSHEIYTFVDILLKQLKERQPAQITLKSQQDLAETKARTRGDGGERDLDKVGDLGGASDEQDYSLRALTHKRLDEISEIQSQLVDSVERTGGRDWEGDGMHSGQGDGRTKRSRRFSFKDDNNSTKKDQDNNLSRLLWLHMVKWFLSFSLSLSCSLTHIHTQVRFSFLSFSYAYALSLSMYRSLSLIGLSPI